MEKIIKAIKFIKKTDAVIRSRPQRYFSMNNKEFAENHGELYKELSAIYEMVFKKPSKLDNSKCSSCFIDRYFELKNLKTQEIMNKINIPHKMRAGFVAQIGTEYFSSESPKLTHEICVKIRARYGDAAFEYFDTNYKDVEYTASDVDKVIKDEDLSVFFDGIPKPKPVVEPEPVVEPVNIYPEFSTMTVRNLRNFAKEKVYKLKATKKEDIISELYDNFNNNG